MKQIPWQPEQANQDRDRISTLEDLLEVLYEERSRRQSRAGGRKESGVTFTGPNGRRWRFTLLESEERRRRDADRLRRADAGWARLLVGRLWSSLRRLLVTRS